MAGNAAHGRYPHGAARLVSRGMGGAGGGSWLRSLGVRPERAEPQDFRDACRLRLRAGSAETPFGSGRAVCECLVGPQKCGIPLVSCHSITGKAGALSICLTLA